MELKGASVRKCLVHQDNSSGVGDTSWTDLRSRYLSCDAGLDSTSAHATLLISRLMQGASCDALSTKTNSMVIMLRRTIGLFVASTFLACGSAKPAAPPPQVVPKAPAPLTQLEVQPSSEERSQELPTNCSDTSLCTPPVAFAERLCSGVHPEVALHLFAPATPWKRAYLRHHLKAWYVGGRGDERELHGGEEVLILREGGGMGGKAYDTLRWDGTCVSLMEAELSFKKPAGSFPANIPWKRLEPTFQSAFSEDRKVEMALVAQDRACKATQKEPQKTQCELAQRQLSLAIAQSVLRGRSLPSLASIP